MSKFKITATEDKISINGFIISPGEVERVTSLISIAGSMYKLNALPPNIKGEGGAFTIDFDEDGVLKLSRLDRPETVQFEFADTSDLIMDIQSGLAMAIDQRVLAPKPRSPANFDTLPGSGDVF